MIHPTAIVDPAAELAEGVRVAAYAIVEAGVRVGAGTTIAEHAVLRSGARLGERCQVDSYVSVAGHAQMRNGEVFVAEVSIGDDCVLREGVTVNRPSRPDGRTVVGDGCFLMANSHVGHDSRVGDQVTIANNVMLAGHVLVGDGSFLGGGAGVHQFVRIGQRAMVGGNASVSYDVPPYAMAAGRNEVRGLNFVGLRRSGTPADVVADLKRAYHAVYHGAGDFRARAKAALAAGECGLLPAGREFLEFFLGGERGFTRPRSC